MLESSLETQWEQKERPNTQVIKLFVLTCVDCVTKKIAHYAPN